MVTFSHNKTTVCDMPERLSIMSRSLQETEGASQKHFSLSEEARNTERHHSWNSDLKLRHSRVAFVSAGTSSAEELTKAPQNNTTVNSNVQAKDKEIASVIENQPTTPVVTLEIPMSKVSLSDAPFAVASESGTSRDPEGTFLRTSRQGQLGKCEPNTGWSNDVFFTDLNGAGQCTHTGLPPPITRHSPSPAASDSGDEIILFVGRKSNRSVPHMTTSQTSVSGGMSERNALTGSLSLGPSHRSMATFIDDPIEDNTKISTAVEQHTLPNQQMLASPKPAVQHTQELANGDLTSMPGKRRRGRRRKRQQQANEEAQMVADYIANTNDSDDLDAFAKSFGLNQRDLGGSDNAEWEDEETVSVSEQQRNVPLRDLDEWDVADLQDFDEISTSSEALDNIERVLLSRQRPSGVQYLVVGQGHKVDDARWLSLAALDVPGANEKVRIFEEEQAEIERLLGESDCSEKSMSLDEQLALDVQGDMEDLEDEEDLVDRRKARMTDEQIARLLSKQEELGLGSEDLGLFDGRSFNGGDEVEAQLDGMWDGVVNFQDQSKPKRKKRAQPNFPSATALADMLDRDPYNGFDVMDQDRPSLRRKPKGRRRNLPMELSDSELELQIQMAWENDRSKKKKRKQEREELRAQGLLGKTGKPDLKAKYTEGMSIVEVKSEIKDFLLSSLER